MEKVTSLLTRRSDRFYVIASVLWVIAIGLLDGVTDYRLRLSPFYLPALFILAWFSTFRGAMAMAIVATAIWIIANRINQNPSLFDGYLLWNIVVLLLSFASFAIVVASLRTQMSNAGRDALTHLANRRTLDHYLRREIARCRRTRQPFTVGYIDVDNFKSVNDRFGHPVGDRLLQAVGRTVEAHIRPTDLAVRLGGDEFAVVLTGSEQGAARKTFEKLRTRLVQAMVAQKWPVSFSIGVATFVVPPQSPEEALKAADRLMYVVKHEGKGHLEYRKIEERVHAEA